MKNRAVVSGLTASRADRARRMRIGLELLATSGLCICSELVEILAQDLGLQSRSGALKPIFSRYLPEAGLTIYQVLPFFRAGLAVVRLTAMGKQYCHENGWEVQESEWERLLDLSA